MDGKTVASAQVIGRTLPVAYTSLRSEIEGLLAEIQPAVAISLGLWPGEPVIRIERIGVNVTDFEIPDNEGKLLVDEAIQADGLAARLSTLPIRKIEQALLDAGIPARISSTAGTFLCNACRCGRKCASGMRLYSPPLFADAGRGAASATAP
jgi:pyroglutamyl-peptidase